MKRQQVARVIELLENGFGATISDDGDGGRLNVMVNGFPGQFSRRDLDVALWDSIGLHGPGFSAAEIKRHKDAVALEDKINDAIQVALFGYHG